VSSAGHGLQFRKKTAQSPLFVLMMAGVLVGTASIAAGETGNLAAPTTAPAATTMAAAGPGKSVAAAVVASPLDSEEIHRGTDAGSTGNGLSGPLNAPSGGSSPGGSGTAGSSVGLLRVTLALLGVLGLIVAMKIVMRWLWPGAASQRASRSVRVIARTPLSSKSALVLVQVGKRLVVVGDCGTQLSSICQITDPDEVAGMLGAIQTERLGSAARRFAIKLGRAQGDFDEADELVTEPSAGSPDRLRGTVGGGAEIDAARDGDGTDGDADRNEVADQAGNESVEPDALVNTRQELRGLASRVRALAEQFRKPNA
jgi:flagellar biogenesis protein FliO